MIETQEALEINSLAEQITASTVEKTIPELTEDQKVLAQYRESINLFINKVSSFGGSKSQLQRVLINLMVHPLTKEEDLHFSYLEEKELFDIATSVNSTKFMFLLAGLESQNKIKFIEQTLPTVE